MPVDGVDEAGAGLQRVVDEILEARMIAERKDAIHAQLLREPRDRRPAR